MTPGLRLLKASLPQPRRMLTVAVWSGVECLPGLLSGYTIARAVDALVARHPYAAGAWLLLFALGIGTGVLATRRLYAAIAPLLSPSPGRPPPSIGSSRTRWWKKTSTIF